jgi:hypothetical protein
MAKYIIDIDESALQTLQDMKDCGCGLGLYAQTIYDAKPVEEEFEWCHGCKEHDTKKHCCHRWSKVIRNTLNDNIHAVLEDIKAEMKELVVDESDDRVTETERTFYNSGIINALKIIDKYMKVYE